MVTGKKKRKIAAAVIGLLLTVALGTSIYTMVMERKDRIQFEEKIAGLQEELKEKDALLDELRERTAENIEVYLPDHLFVAVGRTLELYNRQVSFSGEPDDYYFNWVCDIGKNLERKFQVTGKGEQVGEHSLTLTIYDRNLEPVYEKEIVLEVVENTIDHPMEILNIGDSLSDGTPWYQEVRELSGGQITFVGTRGEESTMHEGRSGFSICDYLTETDYPYGQEGVHPFYNPKTESFDFSYYKKQTGISPDAVQIFLGKNGMSLNYAPGIAWLKEIVDDIRDSDPGLPIYLVQTIYMGDQNGIGNEQDAKGRSVLNGWWKLEEDRKVFLWTKAMDQTFGTMENVYLIPASISFDSEYNYRTSIENVNARSSRTEEILSEGMHPNAEGYLQLADMFFSTYCGTMNQ